MATITAMPTTSVATTTATTIGNMQQQQQQQRPLRGISIIIESAQSAKPAGNSIKSDEMSLKSQSMLLAFGDNSNSSNNNVSNLQMLQVDHAANVDFKTSYNTAPVAAAAEVTTTKATATATATLPTATATTIESATKLYPQLLLRIGQTEAEVEAEAEANAKEIAATTAIAAAATTTAATTTATIISCNVADDVRNLLPAEATTAEAPAIGIAVAGEIEESALNSNSNISSSSSSSSSISKPNDNDASQLTLVDCSSASAVTETVAVCAPQHTVKIQIANGQSLHSSPSPSQLQQRKLGKQISVVKLNDSHSDSNMVLHLNEQQQQLQQQQLLEQQLQQQTQAATQAATQVATQAVTSPYQLCYLVSSGQYSPCETLDSGMGSDLESNKSHSKGSSNNNNNSNSNSNSSNNSSNSVPKLELHLKTTRIRVNGQGAQHSRAYSLTDSEECDESSSSLSCDSLHSNEAAPTLQLGALLPSSLLRDIRDRDRERERETSGETAHREQSTERHVSATKIDGRPLQFEADQYYNFHVNEIANFRNYGQQQQQQQQQNSDPSTPDYETLSTTGEEPDEDVFAGYKDVHQNTLASTIRSSKGTVRGVKNRVRNGVATFLQLQQPTVKNYLEKDLGKVVLYTTSMGIIRDTYAKCANVKQILRTLLIKFEERDVFMSLEYQQEMRDRMHYDTIRVPQLFVEGQLIGDADVVERLNESGELRQLLRPYKSLATAYTCQTCGGYRLLPCSSCSGSKKSVHRNHFTTEFVALKCMNCDEVGLVKCPNC